jgi:hypothetical protein
MWLHKEKQIENLAPVDQPASSNSSQMNITERKWSVVSFAPHKNQVEVQGVHSSVIHVVP